MCIAASWQLPGRCRLLRNCLSKNWRRTAGGKHLKMPLPALDPTTRFETAASPHLLS
jgi:hypothetical protein